MESNIFQQQQQHSQHYCTYATYHLLISRMERLADYHGACAVNYYSSSYASCSVFKLEPCSIPISACPSPLAIMAQLQHLPNRHDYRVQH